MYHECLQKMNDLREYLRQMVDFIFWLDDHGVYLMDEGGSWQVVSLWFIRTENHGYQPEGYWGYVNLTIPEPLFVILDLKEFPSYDPYAKPFQREVVLTHMEQPRMRLLEPKDWPLYLNKPHPWFEKMIKAGKWVEKD